MLQLRKRLLLRCLELVCIKQRLRLADPSTNISNRQAWLWSLLALLMLMLLKAVVSLRLMETQQASDDPPMQVAIWLKPISVGCLVMSLLSGIAEKRKRKEKTTPFSKSMRSRVLSQAAQVWQCRYVIHM